MFYDSDSWKLDRLHTDILAAELFFTFDRLHALGQMSDEDYVKFLNEQKKIIVGDLTRVTNNSPYDN